jgi:long-chain acyl-CoA synthetase
MPGEFPGTIYDAFDSVAEVYPRKSAIIYLGTAYSYGRIRDWTGRFATALYDIGVREGEKVILYIPNCLQWVIAWLAIQRLEAIAVPITPIYASLDLLYVAGDSEAETIVCTDTNFGYVKQVLPESKLKRVIVTNLADLLPLWKRTFGWIFDKVPKGKTSRDANTFSFRGMIRKYPPQPPGGSGNGNNVAEILYTGGTTKFPKGVPITHALFLECSDEQIRASEPLFPNEENVILTGAPLFHILGQTCALTACCMTGGTIILLPRANLDGIFESVQRFRAKTLIGVPALYRMILEHDRVDQYDLSSLQYCFSAGDVLPIEVRNRWLEKFHKPIYQGYGATETCGGVTMCPTGVENPPNSMGRLVPSKEVKIVDPNTLESVPLGEPGELIVFSRRMVTQYWRKPEETERSFVEIDGKKWYRTGDIVSADDNGYFYFVDRTVDTIKHKGYRVSASEIESVLQEHPAVISSCAVGIPDPMVGERIKAFVVLKEDIKGITGYDLIKWCRERLVSYKVPQYIEFRDMLPKSKVGKLLRRELRAEERKKLEGA